MRVINIAASNLAKLTGHNRYDKVEDTIKYILNSNNIINHNMKNGSNRAIVPIGLWEKVLPMDIV